MYKETLELLSAKPSEAVMIGDTPNIDVVLPRKIGMRAILLNRSEKVLCANKQKLL